MLEKLIPYLNKYIPGALAIKGIEKADPKMKSFIKGAVAAGYGTDELLDFLDSKVEQAQSTIAKGERKGALLSEKAAAEDVKRGQGRKKVGKALVSGGAALAGGIAGQTIPAIASLLGEGESEAPKPSKDSKRVAALNKAQEKFKSTEEQKRRAKQFATPEQSQQRRGLVDQERERFQQEYGQQQDAQNAYQAVIDAANRISQM